MQYKMYCPQIFSQLVFANPLRYRVTVLDGDPFLPPKHPWDFLTCFVSIFDWPDVLYCPSDSNTVSPKMSNQRLPTRWKWSCALQLWCKDKGCMPQENNLPHLLTEQEVWAWYSADGRTHADLRMSKGYRCVAHWDCCSPQYLSQWMIQILIFLC